MKKLLIIFCLLIGLKVSGAVYYTATNGLPSNLGTLASPWDLWTAGHKTNVIVGGDFILLLGGSYTNYPRGYITNANAGSIFEFMINGDPGNNVTIMPYSNNIVIIDSLAYGGPYGYHSQDDAPSTRPTIKVGDKNFSSRGHNLSFYNLEIMSSSTEIRYEPTDSSFAPSLNRGDGVDILGRSNLFVNCYVHDLQTGISFWDTAGGTILYGNTIYNNGWMGTPHRHGHGMYTQGVSTSQPRFISTNFMFNAYDNNYQVYGSSVASLFHYRINGNVIISADTLLGGRSDANSADSQIIKNFYYNSVLAFIYQYGTNFIDIKVTDNYLYGDGFQGGAWQSAIVTNNTVITFGAKIFDLITSPVGNVLPWNVDRNRFHAANVNGKYFTDEGFAPVDFPNWKATTGYELNSQFFTLPTTNYIIVMANAYDTGKCHVVVYNHGNSNSVTTAISASTGWGTTDSIRVRNIEDPFVDIVTNLLVGGSITLDMQAASHSIAIPLGTNSPVAPKTFPNFGAFTLERLSATTNITRIISLTSVVPSSGVIITNTPADLSANTQTVTPGSLVFNLLDNITLDAPLVSLVTNTFVRWDKNGMSYSPSNSITFPVLTNDTFTAVYVAPATITNNVYLISRRRPL